MGQRIQVQHLQAAIVHLDDDRDGIGPATAMDGQKNLRRGPVYDQTVDDDLIRARAQKGRQFSVDTPNQVAPLEGVGIAQGNIRLRGDVGGMQLERVNRGAFGIADKQHVVGSKRQHTSGFQHLGGFVLSQHRLGRRQHHGHAKRQKVCSPGE